MKDYSHYYPVIYDSISNGVSTSSIASAIQILNPDLKHNTIVKYIGRIKKAQVNSYEVYKLKRDKITNIPDHLVGSEGLIEYLQAIEFDNMDNFPDITWGELSKRFGGTSNRKWAYDTWKRYINKSEPEYLPGTDLEKIKVIKEHGQTKWETFKKEINPESDISPQQLQTLELEGYTSNPYGGGWAKYKKQGEFTFGEEELARLNSLVENFKFISRKKEGSGIGCIDIADLHIGLLHILGVETLRKPDFNLSAVEHYLSKAVNVINSYNFKEVHLFFPGDLAESFTGKNHRDTWKHLEKFKDNVIIVIYKILKNFLNKVFNISGIYFVDGNHDRLTERFETNSRRGISEVVSFFLKENTDYHIEYHPLMIQKEIDGIFHIMTHGDYKPWITRVGGKKQEDYGHFLFKYGKKGMFNILKTGHYHGNYEVKRQGNDFLHYQCPSISTGNFYEESIGYDHVPGISVVQNEDGIARIDFRPFKSYKSS